MPALAPPVAEVDANEVGTHSMTEKFDECKYDDGDEAYAGEEYGDDEEMAETYAGQYPLMDPSSIVLNAVRGVAVIMRLMLLLVAIFPILSW